MNKVIIVKRTMLSTADWIVYNKLNFIRWGAKPIREIFMARLYD